LQLFRTVDSAVPLGLICETTSQLRGWRQIPVEYLMLHRTLVTPKLIREIRESRRKVFVWTVNTASEMQHLEGLGVHGIISDNTSLLCRALLKNDSPRNNQ